jgi:hypothetical protein
MNKGACSPGIVTVFRGCEPRLALEIQDLETCSIAAKDLSRGSSKRPRAGIWSREKWFASGMR